MKRLYVLYDAECELCRRCGGWLSRQPTFIQLVFYPLQSPDLATRFRGIEKLDPAEQLRVISDQGAVYRGANAWVMCFYALRFYRHWAQRLAHPALLPCARKACELVSQNRLWLSRHFLKATNHELETVLATSSERPASPVCAPT